MILLVVIVTVKVISDSISYNDNDDNSSSESIFLSGADNRYLIYCISHHLIYTFSKLFLKKESPYLIDNDKSWLGNGVEIEMIGILHTAVHLTISYSCINVNKKFAKIELD